MVSSSSLDLYVYAGYPDIILCTRRMIEFPNITRQNSRLSLMVGPSGPFTLGQRKFPHQIERDRQIVQNQKCKGFRDFSKNNTSIITTSKLLYKLLNVKRTILYCSILNFTIDKFSDFIILLSSLVGTFFGPLYHV